MKNQDYGSNDEIKNKLNFDTKVNSQKIKSNHWEQTLNIIKFELNGEIEKEKWN